MRTVDYPATVYYHHTDCGGVVYYARYLEFLEEARTALFREAGLSLPDLQAQGQWFAVARQETEHLAPARYGDCLTVRTWLRKMSRVKVVFGYELTNQAGQRLLTAETVMASVGADFVPRPLPAEVGRALQPYIEGEKVK